MSVVGGGYKTDSEMRGAGWKRMVDKARLNIALASITAFSPISLKNGLLNTQIDTPIRTSIMDVVYSTNVSTETLYAEQSSRRGCVGIPSNRLMKIEEKFV